eukprot:SAG22_NODE_11258_length_493_cov_1.121827_1_plen_164_part_11
MPAAARGHRRLDTALRGLQAGVGGAPAAGSAPASAVVQTGAHAGAGRSVIAADDSTKTLARVGATGIAAWRLENGAIHDLHLLPSGNLLAQNGWTRLVEYSAEGHDVVWEYDAAASPSNAALPLEIHGFQRLENGVTMVAESGRGDKGPRIIELSAAGEELLAV